MKDRGFFFLTGFILGAVIAFGIAGYYYEIGKGTTKLKENKIIKTLYPYEEKPEEIIKI